LDIFRTRASDLERSLKLRTGKGNLARDEYLRDSSVPTFRECYLLVPFHSRKFFASGYLTFVPSFNHISLLCTLHYQIRNRGHHVLLSHPPFHPRAPRFRLIVVPASILSHSTLLSLLTPSTRTCASLISFLPNTIQARNRRMSICLTLWNRGAGTN
jgi:hypothetical protein